MHPMQGKAPLAERMRPTTLDGYVGQAHLVGEGLRRSCADLVELLDDAYGSFLGNNPTNTA